MSTGNMRRAQLVAPFGVGAMSILVDGSSVITAGLDHWYESDEPENLYVDEYVVPEWRLQERLRVRWLRLPPDYRRPRQGSVQPRNLKLTVPVLRFPRWCFCIYCKRLSLGKLSAAQRTRCVDGKHATDRQPVMSQVPFIAVCERGHLDDFPFREWVHRSVTPTCTGVLRLLSQGGGTLKGQLVKCDSCGQQRSLEGITQGSWNGDEERTTLSTQLERGAEFLCGGSRPWVSDDGSGCGLNLRGALRAAGNVYFPKVESSIYLPRHEGGVKGEVLDVLRRPDVQPKIGIVFELLGSVTVAQLRQHVAPELLKPFGDEELSAGLAELLGGATAEEQPVADESEGLTSAVAWRYPEFALIRETPSHPDLSATDPTVPARLQPFLARVRKVEVLRETRALRGFTRVRDGVLRLNDGKALLRKQPAPHGQEWLPAYVVKGEGIYLELDAGSLHAWEQRADVRARAQRVSGQFANSRHGATQTREISPRLILIHTLAHVLINQLIYTCGYSSAALRERLYVSDDPARDMAGVLIYTAAGDSEGTMGGLVRMARPENLSPVVDAAVARARWCSTDPVCMEIGELGQGPESCNLAACHGCALVPETSCEEFNRFLDRGLLVGTFENRALGFLANL